MKIGIMQPYLFPYLGYFQLIDAVDCYILYDNVKFVKKRWMNRNQLLVDEVSTKTKFFTFRVKAGSNERIRNKEYAVDVWKDKEKLLRKLKYTYRNAPHFQKTYQLVEDIICDSEYRVGKFNCQSIVKIANYLDIHTRIITDTDQLEQECEVRNLKFEDRIIYLCEHFSADQYINSIGGVRIYNQEIFEKNRIRLSFLETNPLEYTQFVKKHVPNLSIIDVLMFNSVEETKKMIKQYKIIDGKK